MAEKDYSQLDKPELIKIIEKLESRKKYGLIWDEEKVKEKFEKDAENALPVLKEIKGKEIVDKDTSKPVNFLIEGDNYHALSVLNFTHQGKIDVIYIDPPYNTGDRSWKYNNAFVDDSDEYRHSKWISMMQKRLLLAKNLLKEDGVLIVAIDDNEVHRLRMLLDEIMPNHEVTSITIVHNPRGNITNNFARTHEYALFVIPKGLSAISRILKDNTTPRKLRRWGHNSTRKLRPTMFYPIYVKDGKIVRIGVTPDNAFHPKSKNISKKSGEVEVWPIDQDGVERRWNFGLDSIGDELDRIVAIEKNGEIDLFLTQEDTLPKTVWTDSDLEAGRNGASLVKAITGKDFPFPKSIFTVMRCIQLIVGNRPNAVVLDFFAGSGTTGHAVLELNKQDNGKRNFLLCTNNENEICEEITYPRVKNVIAGYKDPKGKKVLGFGGSLKYFKTKFIKKRNNGDDFKTRITAECTEMLCLREGVFNEIKKGTYYRIFKHGTKTMAVYYSLEREFLPVLKKELEKIDGEKILYCFTLDPSGLSKTEFAGWQGVSLEPIPQKILDVYKQIYEY